MSFLPYSGGSPLGWMAAFSASGVVHAGLLVAALGIVTDRLVPRDEPARTRFAITLERLDADTLAGVFETSGEAGSEGDVPEGTDPESLAPEQDLAEAASPVPADTPVPDEVPPVEPDVADEPEELAAVTPDPIEPDQLDPAELASTDALLPDEPEAIAPEALAPATAEAIPIQPDSPDLSPILPETVAVGSTSGQSASLAPVAPDSSALDAVSPVTTSPDPSTPDALSPAVPEVERQTVTALTTTPQTPRPATPAAPPSEQDLAIGDLIERIRGALADPCLIALPRRDGEDGVGLALMAAQDGAMEGFAQEVLTADDADIRQTRTLVDPRQCPALTYIRQNMDYPATRMGLRIDMPDVQSGGRLTGVLRGGSGRYVTLLLIDDNGVVQDLQRFLSFSGNLARFDVPVTRSGPLRDTSQILLALATERPPIAIRDRAGQLAQDVFAGLAGELADGAFIAVATFDVR